MALDAAKTLPLEKPQKVVFIHSEELVTLCDKLPRVSGRASLTHSLVAAYGLFKNLRVVPPRRASSRDLTAFHSPDYIACLEKSSTCEDYEEIEDELAEFGLSFDCPMFDGLFECTSLVAGGTLCAAEKLNNKECTVAINWQGGWHHAHRDEASGFCYINDIVLGILKLREKFNRVLYVDIDLHHGDGVEDAFSYTSKVMTVSFHKYSEGFFPGTGTCCHVGEGKGKYYSLNVPLKDGITDKPFAEIFFRVMSEVKNKFKPDAVVCQCGVDTLAGDPMASFNLTQFGVGACVKYLMGWNLPLLLLGGGGYNPTNAARCWTYITGVILNQAMPRDIPEHKYFLKYGPTYQLDVPLGLKHDLNSNEHVENILNTISGNLQHVA